MASKEIKKQEASGPGSVERASDQAVYRPDVDILETDNEVLVIADVPGVDEKSVNVTLEDGVLSIEGFVQSRINEDEYKPGILEYGIGNYERSFSILSDVDPSTVQARVKNGVLRVILPKTKESKRHVIDVASE